MRFVTSFLRGFFTLKMSSNSEKWYISVASEPYSEHLKAHWSIDPNFGDWLSTRPQTHPADSSSIQIVP